MTAETFWAITAEKSNIILSHKSLTLYEPYFHNRWAHKNEPAPGMANYDLW